MNLQPLDVQATTLEIPETIPEITIPPEQDLTQANFEALTIQIKTLNDNIIILNESVCNNETVESVDYSPQLEVLTNRLEILTSEVTIFISTTFIVFVLFILYSAIRKFTEY